MLVLQSYVIQHCVYVCAKLYLITVRCTYQVWIMYAAGVCWQSRYRYVLLTVRYEYNNGGKCSRMDPGVLEMLEIQYLWSDRK